MANSNHTSADQRRLISSECSAGSHGIQCSSNPRFMTPGRPICECTCHDEQPQTPAVEQPAETPAGYACECCLDAGEMPTGVAVIECDACGASICDACYELGMCCRCRERASKLKPANGETCQENGCKAPAQNACPRCGVMLCYDHLVSHSTRKRDEKPRTPAERQDVLDADDALGPTRYELRRLLAGAWQVWVHREGCKSWRLGTYSTHEAAKTAVDAWIADKRAQRADGGK